MTLRAALVLVCMAGTNACVTRISSDLVRTELATYEFERRLRRS